MKKSILLYSQPVTVQFIFPTMLNSKALNL